MSDVQTRRLSDHHRQLLALPPEEMQATLRFTFGDVVYRRHANGGGWVSDTADVDDCSRVERGALVSGRAIVRGALIKDQAVVTDRARVIHGVIRGQTTVGGTCVLINPDLGSDGAVHHYI